ncbi:MAG: HAD family hydrolase [Halanaeroarchaeum sp.]
MRYDAVLFDNDGVLTHLTERRLLRRAVERAFDESGVEDPDPADVEGLLVGVDPETVHAIGSDYGVDPERFWRRRDRYASRLQREAIEAGEKPLYYDFDAVLDLPGPRGIVSSNQHPTIESIVEHFGIEDHFETYYGREMSVEGLRRKKPATYYLDRAVEDLAATNPVYVGDSESDVVAAENAGMDAVFVRRPHRADSSLAVEPTAEIRSLRELPEVLNGAP